MGRALNTAQECEEYLFSTFPGIAQTAIPFLQKLTPLLDKDIGNKYLCIKGYTRKDGIGFCIAEKDDQITEPEVRTNFVVIKPNSRIIDFYHRGDPNNFAIIKKFNEIDLKTTWLDQQLKDSFTNRALDKGFDVRW
jgi:hypothetical protein